MRATYGLAPLDRFWDQVHHADVELVLAAEAFDFPGPLPANVRYVGPVLDDPSWSRSWTPPPGEDPLVLVALSSTFQDQVGCLQRIVDALADLPVRAVVTTGQAVEPDALRAPANVQVVASAPHTEVLRHAAAVVTHGGHGTVMKSLAAGVPMVLLPHGRDQADNAIRVTRRHAGVSVGRRAKPAKIRAAVQTVLADPSYAADARALGDLVRREADGQPCARRDGGGRRSPDAGRRGLRPPAARRRQPMGCLSLVRQPMVVAWSPPRSPPTSASTT